MGCVPSKPKPTPAVSAYPPGMQAVAQPTLVPFGQQGVPYAPQGVAMPQQKGELRRTPRRAPLTQLAAGGFAPQGYAQPQPQGYAPQGYAQQQPPGYGLQHPPPPISYAALPQGYSQPPQ